MNWKKRAEELEKEGFPPGGPWEGLFERALRAAKPKLVQQLGSDLTYYVRVRAATAKKHYETLLDEGTDPQTAHELAQAELLNLD